MSSLIHLIHTQFKLSEDLRVQPQDLLLTLLSHGWVTCRSSSSHRSPDLNEPNSQGWFRISFPPSNHIFMSFPLLNDFLDVNFDHRFPAVNVLSVTCGSEEPTTRVENPRYGDGAEDSCHLELFIEKQTSITANSVPFPIHEDTL